MLKTLIFYLFDEETYKNLTYDQKVMLIKEWMEFYNVRIISDITRPTNPNKLKYFVEIINDNDESEQFIKAFKEIPYYFFFVDTVDFYTGN